MLPHATAGRGVADGTIYAGWRGFWGLVTNHVQRLHGERRPMQKPLLDLYLAYASRFRQGHPTLTLWPDGTGAIEADCVDGRETVAYWNSPEEGIQKLQDALKNEQGPAFVRDARAGAAIVRRLGYEGSLGVGISIQQRPSIARGRLHQSQGGGPFPKLLRWLGD